MAKFNLRFLDKVNTLVRRYASENDLPNTPVHRYRAPDALARELDLNLGRPTSDAGLLKQIQQYLRFSVRTGHKMFFNQLFSGSLLTGVVGDLLVGLTHTTMATYEAAPVATLMENELIRKMNSLVGFPDGEGIFVTGGSNANLVAMLCARNQLRKEIKLKGLGLECERLVVFTSDQAHYSISIAANVLGIGTQNVIRVQSDAEGRMIPRELEREIVECSTRGEVPFFINATGGTTVVGAFDPLRAIAKIARKRRIWLHVDGAYGAAVLLSSKHRHLMRGAELADSVAWDPHKLMGLPLSCSVVLLKTKGILRQTCEVTGTEYLFHDYSESQYDLGPRSLQCGRRVEALKLWLTWKKLGDRGFETRIDRMFELAEYLEGKVKGCKSLELMAPRSFVNICFRYRPKGRVTVEHLNQLNVRIRENLKIAGKCMVNYAQIRGEITIRMVVINPELQKRDLNQLVNWINEEGALC